MITLDYNTGLGNNSGNVNTSGTLNTYIGANTNTITATLNNSTAIGQNASITLSNQLVLGTGTEFTLIKGGLNYSIETVSTSTTVASPVKPLIFCSGSITITLPTPTQDGATTTIRLLAGAGPVSVSYATIYKASSQLVFSSVPNNVSSTYIYQSPAWYQVSTF